MLRVRAPHMACLRVVVFGLDDVATFTNRKNIRVIIRAATFESVHMVAMPFVAGIEFSPTDMALPIAPRENTREALRAH